MRAISITARLFAATSICAISAPAFAQQIGQVSTDSTLISNPAGSIIQGDSKGIFSTGPVLNLDNAGTIRGNGLNGGFFSPDAGVVVIGGPANISNTGTISGARFGITTTYVFNPDGTTVGRAIGSAVTNTGSIIGDTDDGIRLIGGGTVTNSGYIAGRVGGGADGISMFAYDGQSTSGFTSIGTVTNLAGGTIEGNRFGVILSSGGTIANAGTITGTGGAIVIQSLDAGKIGTITNTGSINGSVGFINLANANVTNSGAIKGPVQFSGVTTASVDNSGTLTALGGPALFADIGTGVFSVSNTATGSITGSTSGIYSQAATFSVVNNGAIRGNGTYDGFAAPSDAGITFAGGPATIRNLGTISGARFGITSNFLYNPATNLLEGRAIGSSITNSGSIIGDTDAGIRLIGGGTVTNSGYIAGRVGATADGVTMFAFNGQDTTGQTSIGTVNNLAGGIIEGSRYGAILYGGGTINNAGTINGGTNVSIRIQTIYPGKIGTVTNSGALNGAVQFAGLVTASITNSGTLTAFGGPAIFADAGTGALSISNAATGSITGSTSGIRQDGPSLTLDNAGTIRGNGTNGSFFNPNAGVVVIGGPANISNTGTISGARFGITTTYVFNPDGTTVGRAIGSAVTNTGSIIGDTDDGIRLIGGGTVTNSGYIAGRVGGGADGISMFAYDGQSTSGFTSIGTVTNLAGGTIEGNRFGVILSSGGTIANAGTITGTGGAIVIQSLDAGKIGTITNTGSINGSVGFINLANANVTNSGLIINLAGNAIDGIAATGPITLVNSGTIDGGTGTAVSLSGGDDVVQLQTGSSISGTVDGGAGIDHLTLSGTINFATSLQTVGRFLNFETLNVLGGYWTAPTTTGIFNSTAISGGTLAINGSITSPIQVNYGGTLGGTGTIYGNVSLASGGTLSPGNSIGTIKVTGNVRFTPGSIFAVQTAPSGASDLLAVNGAVTIDTGAKLYILAGVANYAPTTDYIILTATGGIVGKFDKAVTDYAYFNVAVNTQKKGTISITLAPNGKPLPSVATATTLSAATAVVSLGSTSTIYQSVLMQSVLGAQQAFSSLSGSGYGRIDALMATDFGHLHLNLRRSGSGTPDAEWSGINSIAARGFHSQSSNRRGPISLLMVGGRYDSHLSSEGMSAEVQTRFLASGAEYQSGRLNALASVTTAWHDVTAGRTVSFPGFRDSTGSRYLAQTNRIDFEASYALSQGAFKLAPYGGYSRIMIHSSGFSETGGQTALAFENETRSFNQFRFGFQASGDVRLAGTTLSPHVDVAYQRASGDFGGTRVARFAAGSDTFYSFGSALGSRQVTVDAGMELKTGPITLAASYRGQFSNQWRDQSAVLSAVLPF